MRFGRRLRGGFLLRPDGRGQHWVLARCGGALRALLLARTAEGICIEREQEVGTPGVPFAGIPATVVLDAGRVHSQLVGSGESAEDAAGLPGMGLGEQFGDVASVHGSESLPDGRGNWVSFARESDVRNLLEGCGLEAGQVECVVGVDSALAAACSFLPKPPALAVLVDVGEQVSQLVLVREGAAVFATDLEPGALVLRGSGEGQELPDPAGLSRLRQSVDAVLRNHARESGAAANLLLEAPLWLSGSPFSSARVRAAMTGAFGERARFWPPFRMRSGELVEAATRVAAMGAGVYGLGLRRAPPNLAPTDVLAARKARIRTGVFQAAAALVAGIALIFGLFRIFSLASAIGEREAELGTLQAASRASPAVKQAMTQRDEAYLAALPAIVSAKRTHDLLASLRMVRQVATGDDHWLALVADLETYQGGAPSGIGLAPAAEPRSLHAHASRPAGIVVEFAFKPGAADPLARISRIIQGLREAGQFRDVDLLPTRLRQSLADRSVFAAEGAEFVLRAESLPLEHGLQPALEPSRTGGLFPNLR